MTPISMYYVIITQSSFLLHEWHITPKYYSQKAAISGLLRD